jgi:shikimate dehydrogenase
MDQPTNNRRGLDRERDRTTRYLTGLVGEGISASRSPWLHEREADAHGVRLVYSLYDLAGSGASDVPLAALLEAAKLTGFAGLNVTHPYKQRVMRFLNELSDEARRIGAVNTIAMKDGHTKGYNTDYLGFAEGLRRGLAGVSFDNVLQLGAGGAGAATAHALLEHGTGLLQVHDLEEGRAEALVTSLCSIFGADRAKVAAAPETVLREADGLVNATPVGMVGHAGTPLPPESLRPCQWVADIVYFPLETELLSNARKLGCRTLDGVAMVVFQAAAAFEIFTGLIPDRERMLADAIEHWDT